MKKLKNSRLSTDCRKLQTLALNLSRKNSNGQLMKKSEKARSLVFIQKCGRETFVFLLHGLTGTQLQTICCKSKDTINWNLMDSQSTHVSMVAIGESLFTLFASLTYAYHCLMTLIKSKLWILKGHNSFSYAWKFEPNTPIGFGEIIF